MTVKRYNPAADLFKKIFGFRVQKISVNAGFTCPNRDGTISFGGCTYCINSAFTPKYVSKLKPIQTQLTEGIEFFSKKYKSWKYLAYFQAYTNTYAPLEILKQKYSQALSVPNVIGLVIATRPDCVNEQILDYLQQLSQKYFILIEYGIESTCNSTLQRVNRGHSFQQAVWAIEQTAKRNLLQSAHIILGLPGESPAQMLNHALILSELPINILKIHHLQILKYTQIAKDFASNPNDFHLFSLEHYIDFIAKFISLLSPHIYIDRFINEAPPHLVIAPKWGGKKNFQIIHMIQKKLNQTNLWQGKFWRKIKPNQLQEFYNTNFD